MEANSGLCCLDTAIHACVIKKKSYWKAWYANAASIKIMIMKRSYHGYFGLCSAKYIAVIVVSTVRVPILC